jgi:murein DD-endopeptidase MepM/ murein hydrolase activator NlpD
VNAFDEALFTEPSPQSLRQEPDTITTNHDVEALRHALATHTDPADTETADTDVLSREAHHSIHHPLHHLRITSHFGPRWGRHHRGTDFAAAKGTPILAAQEGVVRFAGWQGGYGKLVIVDHGHGLTTRYGHCSKITVSAGQQVGQGEMIARVGSTGHSTGPHLHFEVRHNEVAVNPMNELA